MAKAGAGSKKSTRKRAATKGSTKKSNAKKAETTKATATKESKTADQSAPQTAAAPDNAQLPTLKGKVNIFGGPKDRGFKPDDKLSLPTGPHFAYELVRSLNPKSFYCSMRWDYHLQHMSPEEGKRWWANKKILVTNPANGVAVIVRAVDYGPHENTGFDIGISPGAAEALSLAPGDEVEIAFADQKAPLGPVSE
jgi:hypothetical protein